MVTDRPGTIGESSPFADEVDQIQASASRDIGLATRELLQERANRLYSPLDRLSVGGYGVCVECAGPIAPARLEAAPEAETCVRCQAGLERLRRLSASSHRGVFAGARTPYQLVTSYPGTPPSATVGMSGNAGERFAPVRPSGHGATAATAIGMV